MHWENFHMYNYTNTSVVPLIMQRGLVLSTAGGSKDDGACPDDALLADALIIFKREQQKPPAPALASQSLLGYPGRHGPSCLWLPPARRSLHPPALSEAVISWFTDDPERGQSPIGHPGRRSHLWLQPAIQSLHPGVCQSLQSALCLAPTSWKVGCDCSRTPRASHLLTVIGLFTPIQRYKDIRGVIRGQWVKPG